MSNRILAFATLAAMLVLAFADRPAPVITSDGVTADVPAHALIEAIVPGQRPVPPVAQR